MANPKFKKNQVVMLTDFYSSDARNVPAQILWIEPATEGNVLQYHVQFGHNRFNVCEDQIRALTFKEIGTNE